MHLEPYFEGTLNEGCPEEVPALPRPWRFWLRILISWCMRDVGSWSTLTDMAVRYFRLVGA